MRSTTKSEDLMISGRKRRWARCAPVAALLVGLLGARPAHAATFSLGKSGHNSRSGANTLTTPWSGTTAGSTLLVAVVSYSPNKTGGGVAITQSGPAEWGAAAASVTGTNVSMYVYYIKNASARGGNVVWNFSASTSSSVHLLEVTGGIDQTKPLDVVSQTFGTAATATASAITTTYDSDMVLAAFASDDNHSMTVPAGFSLFDEELVSGATKMTADVSYLSALARATFQPSVALKHSTDNWAAVAIAFHNSAKVWNGGSGVCVFGAWKNADGSVASGNPATGESVVFDGTSTTSCVWIFMSNADEIQLRAGYTGTVTSFLAPTIALDLTVNAGTFAGPAIVGGDLIVTGGSYDANGGASTVAGLTTVSGGAFEVGAGTQILTGGLTISGGAFTMSSAAGGMKIGAGKTLSMTGGTFQTSGAVLTGPTIDVSGVGTYAFSVTGGSLGFNGMLLKGTDNTSGMNIGNGVTFTRFDNINFANIPAANPASVSYLATITANSLTLRSRGCKFDYNGAASGGTAPNLSNLKTVHLVGNGNGDGRTIAYFESRGAATSGAAAGDSYDADDDSNNDGIGDNAGDSSVIYWPYSDETDTAGTIQGFPSAAFDWNTFTMYSVYVAYSDVAGVASTDTIFVRTTNGDASYSYDIPSIYGNILGAPRWDTVNETATLDVNGNGTFNETGIHVVYVPTASGYIFKLIDDAAAKTLTLPGTGSVWHTPFSDSTKVTTITSPLVSDGTNLYFGGVDPSANKKIFGVQITGGASEKKVVKNILAAAVVDTAPAWGVYSGTTYLFTGTLATAGNAYIYRVNAVPSGTIDSTCCAGVTQTDVAGAVGLISSHLVAGDGAGKLHVIDAASFASGGFKNMTGFPYQDATHSPATNGAILASPYVDPGSGKVYFGDKDGHLYVIDWTTGAKVANYPLRLTASNQLTSSPLYISGMIVVGDSAGNVYFVDQKNAAGAPQLVYTYTLSGSVSSVAYNSRSGNYMVGTSSGQFFYLPVISDPTPTFN